MINKGHYMPATLKKKKKDIVSYPANIINGKINYDLLMIIKLIEMGKNDFNCQ